MLFTVLLIVHAVIAAALVTVILLQKSEGGGLGMGGSPSGLMSARGAADFLTRATAVLAAAFIGFSILLAVLASTRHSVGAIDTSLARRPSAQPATTQPLPAEPTAPFSNAANIAAPAATPQDNGQSVPLAR
ncbi:MAG: preprotein translocase subunit SecG [Janthinobacterium lividum]